MQDVGFVFELLDAGYWMLDAGYWMLVTGYWSLVTVIFLSILSTTDEISSPMTDAISSPMTDD